MVWEFFIEVAWSWQAITSTRHQTDLGLPHIFPYSLPEAVEEWYGYVLEVYAYADWPLSVYCTYL